MNASIFFVIVMVSLSVLWYYGYLGFGDDGGDDNNGNDGSDGNDYNVAEVEFEDNPGDNQGYYDDGGDDDDDDDDEVAPSIQGCACKNFGIGNHVGSCRLRQSAHAWSDSYVPQNLCTQHTSASDCVGETTTLGSMSVNFCQWHGYTSG
tara:strand:+ start:6370 stop:6816 length:447 start_codon:yes stop_codon:yes gene_type:complete